MHVFYKLTHSINLQRELKRACILKVQQMWRLDFSFWGRHSTFPRAMGGCVPPLLGKQHSRVWPETWLTYHPKSQKRQTLSALFLGEEGCHLLEWMSILCDSIQLWQSQQFNSHSLNQWLQYRGWHWIRSMPGMDNTWNGALQRFLLGDPCKQLLGHTVNVSLPQGRASCLTVLQWCFFVQGTETRFPWKIARRANCGIKKRIAAYNSAFKFERLTFSLKCIISVGTLPSK